MTTLAVVLGLAYLVGAVPWSFLAGRVIGGVDLRRVGSGNLGASNTFRALGARVAVPVLLLDVLKGVVAVLVIARLRLDPPPVGDATLAALAGVAAIVGHIFPVYLGFRGGKGIATSAGVFAALQPQAFLAALAVFLLAFAASRGIVSVGSLLAALALPVAVWAVGARRGTLEWSHVLVSGGLAVLIWIKHAANLERLLRGTEKSLFDRSARLARQKRTSA
jgi:glycerol-3-phosphate acyltransferase PlsY